MIRLCNDDDLDRIHDIINDGAAAYRGVIPEDCDHQPYMTLDYLRSEIHDGVTFFGFEKAGELVGVMGFQDRGPVCLIRHAYVRTAHRGCGIGSVLMDHLRTLSDKPMLIGTWAAAAWAIGFYQKHGFALVETATKDRLLRTFWDIPDRQIETSVVLADAKYRQRHRV